MNCRQPPKRRGWKKLWKQYGVLATSKQQRGALLARDKGYCVECGFRHSSVGCLDGKVTIELLFQSEHFCPLHLVDRTKWPECLRYWAIDNLKTVCSNCHAPKTKREAKARAKVKRIAARPKLKKTVKHPGVIDGHKARPA